MNKLLRLVSAAKGRFIWSTTWRKNRAKREYAYKCVTEDYVKIIERVWRCVGPPGEEAPEPHFVFDKSTAVGYLHFVRKPANKFSHHFRMGDPADNKNGNILKDLTSNKEIPYFITQEIIAATVVASVLSEITPVDPESVNQILIKYYETEPYDPLELSRVWMCRLNTTLCNVWRAAPLLKRTIDIVEERGIEASIAVKIATEEVTIPELPSCFDSDNGDGRINISYPGSCFYTIDHHGMSICKEHPSEYLSLKSYEQMLCIAATIYQDITGCCDDDIGRFAAVDHLKEEPKWEESLLLPWERTLYVVLAWDAAGEHKILDQFGEKSEALEAFERFKQSPPASADSLELCLMRNGYFINGDSGSIATHEILN